MMPAPPSDVRPRLYLTGSGRIVPRCPSPNRLPSAHMDDLWLSPYVLAILFFGITVAYASVGLGGGTAYTALLAIAGADHQMIPTLSLALNVIVTTVGSVAFLQQGHGRLRLILPFLLTSVPASYLGGRIELPEEPFYWLLVGTLAVVGVRILLRDRLTQTATLTPRQQLAVSLGLGVVLGLIAGLVGIGGGIYVVPLIIMLGLGTEREAAACGAVFTWANSAAGLTAHLQQHPVPWADVLPLIAAVLLGGLIGAYLGTRKLSPRAMQNVLGAIILIAIVLLLKRLLG
ncbi:hypothetical protein AWN76_001670 [Rhodothermaceae bacterium RA]|nr:hypothetical protein AWN76_001670 [Rhodothermaceae bacterium RA]